MSLRNASGGKFANLAFGRKPSQPSQPSPQSPQRQTSAGYTNGDDMQRSPTGESGNPFGSLGKKIAHQSILPSLANSETRALQE